MTQPELTSQQIREMPYVDFISLVRETNRPPGGKRTVRRWIKNAMIGPRSLVLEVGSNTGFTSLELARVARCQVVGIDVNGRAVQEAKNSLRQDVAWMRRLVSFEEADTRALPFQEDCFDVVVCGGALSFVVEKGIALREIRRTLRPWGFICVSPLFYHTVPPETLVEEISDILGFPIPVWGAEDWEKLFLESDLEVYYKRKVKLMPQSEDRIEGFARMLAAKDHLPASRLVRRAVYERSLDLFRLFNRNHAYLSFLLGILRNRGEPEEMELFVAPWDTYP